MILLEILRSLLVDGAITVLIVIEMEIAVILWRRADNIDKTQETV